MNKLSESKSFKYIFLEIYLTYNLMFLEILIIIFIFFKFFLYDFMEIDILIFYKKIK